MSDDNSTWIEKGAGSNPGPVILPTGQTPRGGAQQPKK